MPTYPVNLSREQLKLLIALSKTTVDLLQREVNQGRVLRKDPVETAELILNAFTRGPKLIAYLEEQLELEPTHVDEEET